MVYRQVGRCEVEHFGETNIISLIHRGIVKDEPVEMRSPDPSYCDLGYRQPSGIEPPLHSHALER